MAAPAAVLSILVTASTGSASAQLTTLDRQLKGTAASANATAATLGSRLAQGAKYGAIGVAALGAVSVKAAADFDTSMRRVNSIAQLPEKQLAKLGDRVRALSGRTAQAPETLAAGLYDLVSSGFDASESMRVLRSSAKGATAGMTDTATSTKAVAAVLNAYRLPASKARKVTDQLFNTVNYGVISFEELATNIGDTLPFASQLGVGLDQLGASIATMTKQGLSSSETMTRIRNVLQTLIKPGEDLQAALAELNVSGEELVKKEGLQGALEALVGTTDGTKEAVAGLFPNIRALGGVLALTGKNSREAEADLRKMQDSAGATSEALEEIKKSPGFQWEKLKTQFRNIAIDIGNFLLPALQDVMKILTDPKLTLDEKIAKLGNRVGKAIEEWGPRAAEAGAKVGLAIIKGVASAFWQSDLLGKLFIGAGALRLLGGPGVFGRLGVAMGRRVSSSMAGAIGSRATASTVSQGVMGIPYQTSTKKATKTAGTRLGKGMALGIGLGMILSAPAIADMVKQTIDEVKKLVEGHKLGAPDREKFAVNLEEMFEVEPGSGRFLGKFKVAIDTEMGRLIFDSRTEKLLKAQSKKLKRFIGDDMGEVWQGYQKILRRPTKVKTFDELLRGLGDVRKGSRTTEEAWKDWIDQLGKGAGRGNREGKRHATVLGAALDKIGGGARDTGNVWKGWIDKLDRGAAKGNRDGKRHAGALGDALDKIVRAADRTADRVGDYAKDTDKSFDKTTSSSGKMAKGVGRNVEALVNGVGEGLGVLKDNLNKSLAAFKVKSVSYSIKKAGNVVGDVVNAQQGGLIPGIRTGALVPGQGSGDKVPLHLDGRLAAFVEPHEYVSVANRTATARLMEVNSKIPRRQGGGIVPRLASGGGLDFALGPYDIPPIQYAADHAGGNSHVHITGTTTPWVVAIGKKLQSMGWMVGEHPAFGGVQAQHSATGGHYDALAIDANTAADETRSEVAAVARLLSGKGGAVGAIAQKLAKLILEGPDGPPKKLGQAILDKAHSAASKFLASQAPSGVAPTSIDSGGSVVAQMGRYLLANRFSRAGAAGIIGNAYRESLWDPGAVGTGGGGLFGFTTSPVSLADMQRYADKRGKPWTDVETQMAFMLGSPGGGGLMTDDYYNGLEAFLKSTNDIHDATYRFMNEWERPGIPAFEDRLAGAQKAFGMKSWKRGGVVQKLAKGGIVELLGETIGAIRHMNDKRTTKAVERWGEAVKGYGVPAKLVERMVALRHDADKFGEYASNAATLSDDGIFGRFLGATEAEWTQKQLSALFKLRNRLIAAKKLLDRQIRQQVKVLKEAESRLRQTNRAIGEGEDEREDLEERLEKAKKAKNKDLEEHLQARLDSLDERQEVREAIAAKLKSPIISSLKKLGGRLKGGSKEFSSRSLVEEALTSVQGIDGPMRKLTKLPAIGALGGEIFEAQVTLRNLDAEAHPTDTGLDIAGLRDVIEAARYGVFDRYAGTFGSGGRLGPGQWGIAGETGRPEIVHGPATVLSPQATQGALAGNIEVHNDFDFDGMDLIVTTTVNGELAKQQRLEHRRSRQAVR